LANPKSTKQNEEQQIVAGRNPFIFVCFVSFVVQIKSIGYEKVLHPRVTEKALRKKRQDKRRR
jgi:hypothetical protein